MSEDTDLALEPEAEGALAAPEANTDTQDDGPSVEDRALAMGWTPKGQFKGDPDKWVDAETFVKRGEEFLPFLKANNKRLEKRLEQAERGLERAERDLKQFGEFHTKTETRAYERALREIKAELAAATAAGDAEAVDELAERMSDMKAEAASKAPKAPVHDAEIVDNWIKANPWYTTDEVMGAAAAVIANKLEAEGVTDTAQQLAEVTKRIKAEFPHKFENPRRREPGAVEGGGSPPRKGAKTRSDLPADARSTMDRWVKQGIITEAQYLKDYFS